MTDSAPEFTPTATVAALGKFLAADDTSATSWLLGNRARRRDTERGAGLSPIPNRGRAGRTPRHPVAANPDSPETAMRIVHLTTTLHALARCFDGDPESAGAVWNGLDMSRQVREFPGEPCGSPTRPAPRRVTSGPHKTAAALAAPPSKTRGTRPGSGGRPRWGTRRAPASTRAPRDTPTGAMPPPGGPPNVQVPATVRGGTRRVDRRSNFARGHRRRRVPRPHPGRLSSIQGMNVGAPLSTGSWSSSTANGNPPECSTPSGRG